MMQIGLSIEMQTGLSIEMQIGLSIIEMQIGS
jgi:hypothetical protein